MNFRSGKNAVFEQEHFVVQMKFYWLAIHRFSTGGTLTPRVRQLLPRGTQEK